MRLLSAGVPIALGVLVAASACASSPGRGDRSTQPIQLVEDASCASESLPGWEHLQGALEFDVLAFLLAEDLSSEPNAVFNAMPIAWHEMDNGNKFVLVWARTQTGEGAVQWHMLHYVGRRSAWAKIKTMAYPPLDDADHWRADRAPAIQDVETFHIVGLEQQRRSATPKASHLCASELVSAIGGRRPDFERSVADPERAAMRRQLYWPRNAP